MANIITAGNSTNGGTAITTDTSGTLNIVTGSGSGSNAITIDASQAVTMPGTLAVTGAQTIGGNLTVTGTLTASGGVSGSITSGTAVSASGTSVTFTGIPSTAKRITIMFSGVSASGTANIAAQIGSGSIDTASTYVGNAVTPSVTFSYNSTSYILTGGSTAATTWNGVITLVLLGSNTWIESGTLNAPSGGYAAYSGGSKALSGALDRVRITTSNGTDTFDAGTVNILWE